ncbi:MAG: AI-2E family transporter [Bacteroidota bacterium]
MQKLQRSVYQLLFVLLGFSLLYFGKEFLVPLALSAIFAMLFIGLCNWFERKGLKRGLAAIICILLFVVLIGIVVFLLGWQLSSMAENLDEMKQRLLSIINNIRTWLRGTVGLSIATQEKIIKEQSVSGSGTTGQMIIGFAGGALSILINAVLVTVYMYLFLYYRTHIKNFILKLAPSDAKEKAAEVVYKAGKVAQKYLSGLGSMILILWIMYGIGFTAIGVENAIFFAVLCGILEIVPFIGNLTGTSLTILSVIVQGGDTKTIFMVLGVYMLVQFIQTYILEPMVVGEQVNINPLFTIMSIVLGELIWGIPGMILAIPLLGIVKIICDHSDDLKPYGFLIGTQQARKVRKSLFGKVKQTV